MIACRSAYHSGEVLLSVTLRRLSERSQEGACSRLKGETKRWSRNSKHPLSAYVCVSQRLWQQSCSHGAWAPQRRQRRHRAGTGTRPVRTGSTRTARRAGTTSTPTAGTCSMRTSAAIRTVSPRAGGWRATARNARAAHKECRGTGAHSALRPPRSPTFFRRGYRSPPGPRPRLFSFMPFLSYLLLGNLSRHPSTL